MEGDVCVIGNPVPGQSTREMLEENGMPVEQSGCSDCSSAGFHCLSTESECAAGGTTKKEI